MGGSLQRIEIVLTVVAGLLAALVVAGSLAMGLAPAGLVLLTPVPVVEPPSTTRSLSLSALPASATPVLAGAAPLAGRAFISPAVTAPASHTQATPTPLAPPEQVRAASKGSPPAWGSQPPAPPMLPAVGVLTLALSMLPLLRRSWRRRIRLGPAPPPGSWMAPPPCGDRWLAGRLRSFSRQTSRPLVLRPPAQHLPGVATHPAVQAEAAPLAHHAAGADVNCSAQAACGPPAGLAAPSAAPPGGSPPGAAHAPSGAQAEPGAAVVLADAEPIPKPGSSGAGAPDLMSGWGLVDAAGPPSRQDPAVLAGVPIDERWSADDRVVLVARALAEQWAALGLHAPIRAINTPPLDGSAEVEVQLVTESLGVEDEQGLLALPERLQARFPGWTVRWEHDRLVVLVRPDGPPAAGGPLIGPLFDYARRRWPGRKQLWTCYYPLASLRHMGLYGGQALGVLHGFLASLLLTHGPQHLALSVLNSQQLVTMYEHTPHFVRAPGAACATIQQLLRALRCVPLAAGLRALLLIVVEPDEELLPSIAQLEHALRNRPAAPLHLIIVQQTLLPAGRNVYLASGIPALVTADGHGSPSWLPGAMAWPRRGMVRLLVQKSCVEGTLREVDEKQLAVSFQQFPLVSEPLLPLLWDLPAPRAGQAAPAAHPVCFPELPPARPPQGPVTLAEIERSFLGPTGDDQPSAAAPAAAALMPSGCCAPGTDELAWPSLPGWLRADQLRSFFQKLLDDPRLVEGQHPGLTLKLLRSHLGGAGTRPLALRIWVWCNDAQLLEEPLREAMRWRFARRFRTTDLHWIAQQLQQTAPPSEERLRQAREQLALATRARQDDVLEQAAEGTVP